jgi:hypothetical protein
VITLAANERGAITVTPRPELRGVTGISSGGYAWSATCGLADHHVACWSTFGGTDHHGVLGRDSKTADPTTSPAPIAAPITATSVSAGNRHVCAIDADGAVWCWGDDGGGGLGRGRAMLRATPSRVVDIGP